MPVISTTSPTALSCNKQTSESLTLSYSDPASLTLTLTATGMPAFGSISGSTLTFSPTSFTQVGTYSVTASVCNSISSCTTYPFTVTFANTAPTFATPSSTAITVGVGVTITYTLPAQTDAEGDSISLTSFTTGQSSLPVFIARSGSTYTISPTLASQIATYSIDAKICDGQPLCTTLTFTVTVSVAQPPLFTNTPTTLTVNLHTLASLTLATSNPLGYPTTISEYFGSSPAIPGFASYASGTYSFSPSSYS